MQRQQATQFATLGGVIVVAVVTTVGVAQVAELGGAIHELLRTVQTESKESVMQFYETTVTSASTGDVTLVHTERADGESVDDWKSRHDAAVAAAKV